MLKTKNNVSNQNEMQNVNIWNKLEHKSLSIKILSKKNLYNLRAHGFLMKIKKNLILKLFSNIVI